jgi:F-type H+-transporting ATPase subunit a
VSLTLRLLLNMMVGHLMLVLFFSATHFFLLSFNALTILSPFTLALGFAFTLFEIFVAFLQAYVFMVLTAVYIQLAVADEH